MTRTPVRWWQVLSIVAVALFAFQVAASPPMAQPGAWTKHENLRSVKGADGRTHTATCSGFPGTDPSFSFWSRKGTSKNLVVFFEGGGACWDNLTCTFPIAGLPSEVPQFYVPAISPATNPATYDGIFKDDPANPVRDWSFVYIPYCTGDIHIGSASKQYFSVGHPVLPVPPGTMFEIQHRGFDNFMVVLHWISKHFHHPEKILVTGSSAGGYGASANFPWVKDAFPHARVYVIADASQGVTTPAFDEGNPGRESWNPQFAPWVFGSDPSAIPSSELLRTAANAYRHVKISQFTTNLDGVQIGFYGVMKQYYPPGGVCPSPIVDWNNQMLGTLESYASDVGNYRYYLAGGTYHTIMRSPAFYTEASAGIPYADWVAAMLHGHGHGGHHTDGHDDCRDEGRETGRGSGRGGWQDAACPTCLTPLPCQ